MISMLLVVLAGAAPALPVPVVPSASQEASVQELRKEAPPVEAAELGATRNVHRAGDLWLAGQFTEADVARLKDAGIARVITLRGPEEVDWDEAGALARAGIELAALPVQGSLEANTLDRLRAQLAQPGPTLVHCGSANRVAAAWIPYRVLDQGVPLEDALKEADEIGLRTPAFREAAIAYVEANRSVKEGINENFLDPELDVQKFVDRFEVESREVYSARHAILAACGVKPGMRVADVGSGTGLYTFLFSEAVGPTGWVYAVDIAPRFVKHVLDRCAAEGVANVTGVLGAERSITLPPASVDVVFTCDTYHHFEYPGTVLASIRRALAPGGRLIVVDFERIEGESSEWVLGHVRAGKPTVRAEIEAAGFELVRDVDVPGLEETYFLELRVAEKTGATPHRD